MGNLDFLVTTIGGNLETLAFTYFRGQISIDAPWTNLPIIKQIIDFILHALIKYLGTKGENGTYSLSALIITTEQGSKAKDAFEANIKAQATGTDAEKETAKNNLIAAARNLKFTNL